MVKVELKHLEQWLHLFNTIASFDADIQSNELMVTVKPYAVADIHEQACVLNKFRDVICPEIIQEASEIAQYLEGQTKVQDPVESMSLAWDDLFIKITGACMDDLVQDNTGFAGLISNFYNQIGEALGPVSYAGFTLRRWFKENYPNDIKYQDWVDECIKYYENNWRF